MASTNKRAAPRTLMANLFQTITKLTCDDDDGADDDDDDDDAVL